MRDILRFPGEFEPQESIWLAWPADKHCLHNRTPHHVVTEMIDTLLTKNNQNGHAFFVDLLVQNEKEVEFITKKFNSPKLRTHIVPHTDIWVRDFGPIFMVNETRQKLELVEFGFNAWSYCEPHEPDALTNSTVTRTVASQQGISLSRSSMISEGGDREFNGKGTLITSKIVEWDRNKKDFTCLEELEQELKRALKIEKVIWMKDGVSDDQSSFHGKIPGTNVYTMMGTGGHVDEFVRFVDNETIALAYVPEEDLLSGCNIAKITHENMERNFKILSSETDQHGQPFKIIRIPVPVHMYEKVTRVDPLFSYLQEVDCEIKDEDTITCILAASYLNFLISNDVVLISKYWKEGRDLKMKERDEQVLKQFKEMFPNREILQVFTEDVNVNGGGMHCISQQMPRIIKQ
jgi:agmatine deiminase